MAVENPPAFLQVGEHSSTLYRRLVGALSGDSSGLGSVTDFQVSQKAAGADMSVDVSAGCAVIVGSESSSQGSYVVESGGVVNLAVGSSDATNPRIDLVVAKVQDSQYSGAVDAWSLVVVAGVPAASPVAPAVPSNSLTLASVLVPASAVSITVGDISNVAGLFWGSDALAGGAITTVKLADDAVTAAKLADDSVTAGKIAADAVTDAAVASGAVTAGKIAADAVTEVKLADGGVGSEDLAAGSVGSDELATDGVVTAAFADGSVTDAKLAAGLGTISVTDLTLDGNSFGEIETFSVTTTNGTVVWSSESGFYCRFKDYVWFAINLGYGSGSTSTQWEFNWPVTPSDSGSAADGVECVFYDASAARYYTGPGKDVSSSNFAIDLMDGDALYAPNYGLVFDSGSPVTMATSDTLVITGMYRVGS